MKLILAALALSETADEQQVVSRINAFKQRDRLAVAFEELTGKQGDEAVGAVKAWKESAAKLPSIEKQLEETRTKEAKASLDQLLSKGRADKKLTKAAADELQAKVEAGNKAIAENRMPNGDTEWTLGMATGYVDKLPVQPHLAGEGNPTSTATTGPNAPPPKPSAVGALTTDDGKTYEQLTSSESAALERDDPATFKSLRADWVKRGEPAFEVPKKK